MNKPVVISGFIIGGTATVLALTNKHTEKLMHIFVGTYIFILVLSFSELIPEIEPLAGGLAVIACIYSLLGSGLLDYLAKIAKA
jgi:hypothetical protein